MLNQLAAFFYIKKTSVEWSGGGGWGGNFRIDSANQTWFVDNTSQFVCLFT
jgi:hypothetical protein